MKNATGISRWTSAGRNHAVHILNDDGSLVLCKKHFFSHNTESFDFEKVTCKKCLSAFNKMQPPVNSSDDDVCRYCKSPNIVENEPWTDCLDCGKSFI